MNIERLTQSTTMRARRLWIHRERTNIPRMDTLIYILVVTMTLSSWANAASPCDAERSMDGLEVTAVAHAHHASSQDVDLRAHHFADPYQNSEQGSDALSADCLCCDDCVAVCVLTGVSPLANMSFFVDTLFDTSVRPIPRDVEFRRGPPPQSLFRPPITLA